MEGVICRTCFTIIKDDNYLLFNKEDNTSLQIELDLQFCVPEMVIDLVSEPIFCTSCVNTLRIACEFKNQCLRTERQIQCCMESMDEKPNRVRLIDIYNEVNDICPNASNTMFDHDQNHEHSNYVRDEYCDTFAYIVKQESYVDGTSVPSDYGDLTKNIKQELIYVDHDYNDKLENPVNEEVIHSDIAETLAPEETPNIKNCENGPAIVSVKYFACNMCDFSTNYKFQLNLHAKIHRPHSYLCNTCKYSTLYKWRLEVHIVQVHQGGNKGKVKKRQIPVEKLVCNVCNYTTGYKQSLKQHMFTHTGERPFSCNICSFSSAYKSCLKTHLLHHKISNSNFDISTH